MLTLTILLWITAITLCFTNLVAGLLFILVWEIVVKVIYKGV